MTTIHFTATPVLSPSNEAVVWVEKRQGTYHLKYIDLATDEIITLVQEPSPIEQLTWGAEEGHVAYVTKRTKEAQLYSVDRQQNVQQLTNIAKGVDQFYWASATKQFWLQCMHEIVILDQATGQLSMSSVKGQLLAISHDGKQVVVYRPEEAHLFLVHVETQQYQCIDERCLNIQHASFSFQNQYIAYVGQEAANAQPALYIFDQQQGITQNMTEMLDAPVGDYAVNDGICGIENQQVAWTETDAFYFQVSVMGDVRLYYGDLYGSLFPASPEEQHVHAYSIATSGNWAIVVTSSLSKQQELIFFDITTGEHRILSSPTRQSDEIQYESIVLETPYGNLYGWLMSPVNGQEKYPLIVTVPMVGKMHANSWDEKMQQAIQQQKMVLKMNISGSYGYGQQFANNYAARQQELATILHYVKEYRHDVDLESIALIESNKSDVQFTPINELM